MKGPAHDKLWNQLEAEIHLHRHKTVIRACRGRNDPKKPLPSPAGHVRTYTHCSVLFLTHCISGFSDILLFYHAVSSLSLHQDPESLKKTQGVGPIRKVLLSKEDHEGLGISITVSPSSDVSIRSE